MKNLAESDILKFIDDSVMNARAFGYVESAQENESKTVDDLMKYLGSQNVDEIVLTEVDERIGMILGVAEAEGFKRGFGIALRIMIAGLQTNNS